MASLGNSKAMLSMDDGKKNQVITKEHSTKNQFERKRILESGG